MKWSHAKRALAGFSGCCFSLIAAHIAAAQTFTGLSLELKGDPIQQDCGGSRGNPCPAVNCNADFGNDIWQVYHDQGVEVVAVDIMEPAPLVQGWALANEVTYHIWLAPDWNLFQEFVGMGGALPYNTVLDPLMTLRYSEIGFDLDDLVAMIETLLAEFTGIPVEPVTWGGIKSLYRN